MKKLMIFALMVAGFALAGNAIADSSVDAVWKCKMNEDMEMDDVHKANAEWVKHINSATDVGEVTSSTITAIVGDQDHFYFVDSYPSLAAWSTVQEYTDSDAGEAAMEEIQGKFEDLFDCEGNKLYKVTPN